MSKACSANRAVETNSELLVARRVVSLDGGKTQVQPARLLKTLALVVGARVGATRQRQSLVGKGEV